MIERTVQLGSWGRRAALVLILGGTAGVLGACNDLLEVDLPAQLTDDALTNPNSAETQVASIVALFGCSYSAFAYHAMGHEDIFESIAGVAGGNHVFEDEVLTGDCDSDSEDDDWGDQMSGARSFAYQTYDRLSNWTNAQVPDREELLAVSAIYAGTTLGHFGEFLCELTIDGGELMTPNQVLDEAEDWFDIAFDHMANLGGDFVMPYGISESARNMVLGLRSRHRWSRGDMAGAVADASQIPEGFMAWVPRDAGLQLRNKIYDAGTAIAFSGMLGVNDWWQGPPNPVTGQAWPSPIPFTGYIFLGIDQATGRALDANNIPIRWAEEFREIGDDPTPLNNGAVADTRVLHFKKGIQGPQPREVPDKYQSEDEDIPLVNWKETFFIEAEAAGGQTAIDMVNHLRVLSDLPQVSYVNPADADQVRAMLIEEKRRELFAEGRFWSTKIQNTDILWFPRSIGETPFNAYLLQGGVRIVMPEDEYNLNPNITLSDRGTGCDPDQRPGTIV